MTSERDLIVKAADLARSAPRAWTEFLGAFFDYSNRQKDYCIQSPLEHLPVAQGRAQQAAHLYGLFEACVRSADNIEGKRK